MAHPELILTSLGDFLPSLHGAERRLQRDISTKDLQNAVMYGMREQQVVFRNGRTQVRYKYTFADVVYITDETSTKEITSWAKPLPFLEMSLTNRMTEQHLEAAKRIAAIPALISSHTVFVVDQSGSMRKSDVKGHRSRSTSVFWNLANNFIAPQLLSGALKSTDVISVIFLRHGAQAVLERAPADWCTFNKIVAMGQRMNARGHGQYIPALQEVARLLEQDMGHNSRSLAVFFLSDGKPSDAWLVTHDQDGNRLPSCRNKWDYLSANDDVNNQIYEEVRALCNRYKDRLVFHAVGFASPDSTEFICLQEMVKTAIESGCSKSRFDKSVDGEALKHALSTLITSTSQMRTSLGNQKLCREPKTLKTAVEKETEAGRQNRGDEFRARSLRSADGWTCYKCNDVSYFTRRCVLLTKSRKTRGHRQHKNTKEDRWRDIAMQNKQALGFGVNKLKLGEGAERLVFEMFEVDSRNRPIGQALVAKTSRFVEDDSEEMAFQEGFVKTQTLAQRLAEKFNERLDRVGVVKDVPRLHFLKCSVYEYYDEQTDLLRAYLAERRLDPAYVFKKWNDNNGWVDGNGGRGAAATADRLEDIVHNMKVDFLAQSLQLCTLEEVKEEEEEEEDDDSEGEEKDDGGGLSGARVGGERRSGVGADILDDDVPQAFSHFTYSESGRRLIVVDLQGVLNRAENAFELTDPCVHHADGRRRGGRHYGRTDKGNNGIVAFFKTHRCNPCCAALGLQEGSF